MTGGWGTKEGIRKRLRDEPASGYVAPSHTGRTLAIAGGVTAATVLGLFLKRGRSKKSVITGKEGPMSFVDNVRESGARELKNLQHAANLKKTSEKTAAQVAAQAAKEFPEFHGMAHSDAGKHISVEHLIPSEHTHINTARRYFKEETDKFHRLRKTSPAVDKELSGYKYYSDPFNVDNPPKRGKYVSPAVFEERRKLYDKKQGDLFTKAKVQSDRAKAKRERTENLERRIKSIEFDISLKESRGKNGQFTSNNGMPPLSPRDLQNAYHAPIIERRKQEAAQAEEPKKPSRAKAAVIGGIGAVLGLATLGAAAPAIRRKILGQAIEETGKVGAAVSQKGSGFTTRIQSAWKQKARNLASENRRLESESIVGTAERDASLTEHVNKAKAEEAGRKTAEAALKTMRQQRDKLRTLVDTHEAVNAGELLDPLLKPQTIFGKFRVKDYKHTVPESVNEIRRAVDFNLTEANAHIGQLQQKIEGGLKGKTLFPLGEAQLRAALEHRIQRHRVHLDHRGELDRIEKDLDKITDRTKQAELLQNLHDRVWRERKDVGSRIRVSDKDLSAKAATAKKNRPASERRPSEGDAISIGETGHAAVQGRGHGSSRGGRKKNTQHRDPRSGPSELSDTRLATRLCRAVKEPQFELIELHPRMIEFEVDDKKEAQKEARRQRERDKIKRNQRTGISVGVIASLAAAGIVGHGFGKQSQRHILRAAEDDLYRAQRKTRYAETAANAAKWRADFNQDDARWWKGEAERAKHRADYWENFYKSGPSGFRASGANYTPPPRSSWGSPPPRRTSVDPHHAAPTDADPGIDPAKWSNLHPDVKKRFHGIHNLFKRPGTTGEGEAAKRAAENMRKKHDFSRLVDTSISL